MSLMSRVQRPQWIRMNHMCVDRLYIVPPWNLGNIGKIYTFGKSRSLKTSFIKSIRRDNASSRESPCPVVAVWAGKYWRLWLQKRKVKRLQAPLNMSFQSSKTETWWLLQIGSSLSFWQVRHPRFQAALLKFQLVWSQFQWTFANFLVFSEVT